MFMMTANTDTNPQVTPSPPSFVRSPIKAYALTSRQAKMTKNNKRQKARPFDPPSRPKNKLLYERRLDIVLEHMNYAAWYHIKQVFSFLIFTVLCTLLSLATRVGIRIVTRLPIKISISIKVIKVVNWLHYFSAVLCVGFIRSGLKTETSHVQNQYAR